ncbi:hypothetical protein BDZ85DRAFT_131683 [Elsinoe ampelina]|uniref:Ankyrin repeat-containing domain protein n=1 Tax=Elsinoe ampelina TaxID=302913 RepID=A0A6A6GAY6_9PEZI|nr:hypothetical protein BDZ85DRAFT_131683 [Elsinoe ampelina]
MGCQSSREYDAAVADAKATATPRRRSRSSVNSTSSPSHSRSDSATVSDAVELPAFNIPWNERVLLACSKGNVNSLRYLLDQSGKIAVDDNLLRKMMITSVASKQKDALSYLSSRHPGLVDEKPWLLRPVHDAIFQHHAGLDMYKVLVARYPTMPIEWLNNDRCDALATVSLENDVPFAKFLIGRGASAQKARIIGIPILIILTQMEAVNIRNVDELPDPLLQQTGWMKDAANDKCDSAVETDRTAMIRLLRKHGASGTIRK